MGKWQYQFLLLLGWLLLLTACDPPEVEFVVEQDVADAAVQVDFVRVPRDQLQQWQDLSPDDYFSPGNRMRQAAVASGAVYSLFSSVPGKAFVPVIQRNDSVWQRFGFDNRTIDQQFDIVVFADLPGDFSGTHLDPRRRLLPLHRRGWAGSLRTMQKLVVRVSGSGVVFEPEPVYGAAPSGGHQSSLVDPEPDDVLHELSELDRHPRRLTAVAPSFSAELMRLRLHGIVRASILIDPQGNVRVLEVLDATHAFAVPAVIEALHRWRFEPPLKDGKPVYAKTIQPIQYDFR
ncbi:MAG: energy transducer TonB [Verrucomicrobia bacterium]|nr:energy transducer TonB [Verrucomicrobiota bacterium]